MLNYNLEIVTYLQLDSVRDLVEMENWLREQNASSSLGTTTTTATSTSTRQQSGGDFSFEKFLTERADARDKMSKQ